MSDRISKTKLIAALGVLSLGLWVSPAVQADPVTFHFAGAIVPGASTLTIVNGDTTATISGFYTFESLTPDTNSSTVAGDYIGALTSLSATVVYAGGSFTITATDGNIRVECSGCPGGTQDYYRVQSNSTEHGLTVSSGSTDPFVLTTFLLTMGPGNFGIFDSDALPLTFPPLFGNPRVIETFAGDLNKLTFSLIPVPEPGTLVLLGLGLAGLGLRLRRRRR
jgi:hypothetical protein